ncbi:MAG: hypothetical protein JST31_09825 [Actinobacteria bacterium]|nr:hypothetical protein [Actinomycetota bacterium]
MPDQDSGPAPLRVLFCIGVTQDFCALAAAEFGPLGGAITAAFDDLAGRFGVTVLGTMDDDQLMMGESARWPFTCYVLADVPDLETVIAVTNIVREVEYGDSLLWRYLRVEARVGRQLFFANS